MFPMLSPCRERTFERNRHDLHVIVGMRPESFARGDVSSLSTRRGAEMDSPGVVISGKTERMVGIEPTMVGVSGASVRGESSYS